MSKLHFQIYLKYYIVYENTVFENATGRFKNPEFKHAQ